MDLAREILLAIEEHPESAPHWDKLDLGRKIPSDQFWGHVRLLADAGYLMPLKQSTIHGLKLRGGLELSSAGHDFLDSTRDPEIWRKTKEGARKAGGSTLRLLGEIAAGMIKAQAIAKLGIPL